MNYSNLNETEYNYYKILGLKSITKTSISNITGDCFTFSNLSFIGKPNTSIPLTIKSSNIR